MKQRKHWIILACIVILLVAAGAIGGFFLGKSAEAARYQEEKDRLVLLNRAELEGLGEIEGTIYVTGHKTPDADSVCGSIAYATLLEKLGYDAVPVVLGGINSETTYILEAAEVTPPMLLEDASGLNIILIDHSDYSQSVEGLQDANILSIIDHHGDGTVMTGNPIVYDARPLGSTSTVILMRYLNYGIDIDKQTACLMMGAILSDTMNFKNNTTTSADHEAFRILSAIAGIADTEEFYRGMYMASISYEGMTEEEIYFSDYKEYKAGGRKYSIACINVYDDESAVAMAERMKAILPGARVSTGTDLAFVQITILHDDLAITYIVPSDEAADEIIRTAYGDRAVFDGTSYRLEPGISRKKELVPAITGILESYPKE